MDWRSVTDITSLRECIPVSGKVSIENMIEDSFVSGTNNLMSIPMPPNVSSTISISMSHDGQYFATTHGDHTVKVFLFHTFKVVREFKGHPRTPWTVKFHPQDSDKVASGCLGCQVMVWSISENICLSKVRLEFSIISISFHPDGDLIAIASGTKLELWDWTKRKEASRGGYNLAPSTAAPPISHVRNIRAVIFHPSGEFLLAAAPDAPRQSNESITYCSLYGIKLSHWLQLNSSESSSSMALENDHNPLLLTSHFIILPQIHLYSDGGLDVTKDGEHLITCSRLFIPPTPPPISASTTRNPEQLGRSPLSTTERMEEDEEASLLCQDRNIDYQQQQITTNIIAPAPFFGTLASNTTGDFNSNTSSLLRRLQFFDTPDMFTSGNQPKYSFRSFNNDHGPIPCRFPAVSTSADASAVEMEYLAKGGKIHSSHHHLVRSFLPTSLHSHGNNMSHTSVISSRFCEGPLHILQSMKRVSTSSSRRNQQPQLRIMNASLFLRDEHGCVLNHNSTPLPPGWRVDDYLCIFKLQFRNIVAEATDAQTPTVDILVPHIVNAKPLAGSLMRAITSVKWSPTNRLVLIGFGVRSEGRVQDHTHPIAACEILSTQHSALPTMKVLEDVEDEVNIAQFHPMPGYGLVYGTKRGKTRAFVRPK